MMRTNPEVTHADGDAVRSPSSRRASSRRRRPAGLLVRAIGMSVAALTLALFALGSSCGVAFAQVADFGIDYIVPDDAVQGAGARSSAGASRSVATAAPASDGELVPYTAFDGQAYSLHRVAGVFTALLIPDADYGRQTLVGWRDLADRFDLLFAHFRELVGGEPAGDGLLPIAFVRTCGGGCGYLGTKGIELDPGTLDPASAYGADAAYRYGIHEMTHNFDLFSGYIMYGADPGHSWTDFMNNYIEVYDRGGVGGRSPDETMRAALDAVYFPYLRFPGRTWERCVRDDACDPDGDMGQHALGGMPLRVSEAHRPGSVTKALKKIRRAIASRGLDAGMMTTVEKNDLLIEGLSLGTGSDLSCFLDQIAWPLSPQLRSTLDARFPANARCSDADGDGWTTYLGDCDDTSAATHPGATEISNGRDDDCDGTIDDVTITEPTDFPSTRPAALVVHPPVRLNGTIASAADSDVFALDLHETTSVTFRLASVSEFAGWLFLYEGSGWRHYGYVGAGGRMEFTETLPAGRWEFAVQLNVESHAGAYEASVELATPWLRPFATPGAVSGAGGSFTLSAPSLASLPVSISANKVRFWVSGFGFVGKAPVASRTAGATLSWTPPAGVDVTTLRYRVQFLKGRVPVSPASNATFLTDAGR